jgi:hypothetical protein
VALAVGIVPTTRDEIHWRWAERTDRAESYGSYRAAWPAGRHALDARRRHDQRAWADARASNTVEGFARYLQLHADGEHAADARNSIEQLHWQEALRGRTAHAFEQYLRLHPEGEHVTEARDSLESLHWHEASRANTPRAFGVYLDSYPQGRFRREAAARRVTLRSDDAPFSRAMRAGSVAAMREFLSEFPGHRKEVAAQRVLAEMTEGRDIVDLLQERKIEVRTQGSGIQSVAVEVRRLTPYALTVRLPVGSYFVSANQSAQNMVTTSERKVTLTTDGWHSVDTPAACANRRRAIPGSGDRFTVQRSPHQAELTKLMPVLDRTGVNYATRQAAVWIVTDDASYADLGILVSGGSGYYGGNRTIREEETARAMKITTEAGIDITRKRIWTDRHTILRGLPEGELKAWLRARA